MKATGTVRGKDLSVRSSRYASPRSSVRFWDLDKDVDVTGQTVPLTANITYRIDTNLDAALQLKYRPEMTSLDSFYTLSLTDPSNKPFSSVYTGSSGKADTKGILIEKNPVISVSPFYLERWQRVGPDVPEYTGRIHLSPRNVLG